MVSSESKFNSDQIDSIRFTRLYDGQKFSFIRGIPSLSRVEGLGIPFDWIFSFRVELSELSAYGDPAGIRNKNKGFAGNAIRIVGILTIACFTFSKAEVNSNEGSMFKSTVDLYKPSIKLASSGTSSL